MALLHDVWIFMVYFGNVTSFLCLLSIPIVCKSRAQIWSLFHLSMVHSDQSHASLVRLIGLWDVQVRGTVLVTVSLIHGEQ